jgi:hypothetical protein
VTVEGAVQRAAVAPFDGYVTAARFRAGETVAEGEVLAEMDDQELRLERHRREGERPWLVADGLASTAYRLAIGPAIAWFLADQLPLVGEVLALPLLVGQMLHPLGRAVAFLAASPALRGRRVRAVGASAGAA